ncbi:hypothetical protein MAR_037861 [Mya arenaria]|uniref:Uncharacterized protein n=1 Tax=Mya arenaria TaxID=6604 RepID=A0ABY7FT47_MYAAR|nr:hypothetical protein MAR_037861 [Mya arenaria]
MLLQSAINGSDVSEADLRRLHLLNDTTVDVEHMKDIRGSQLNELLCVVIMFYAMALMVLIATQIRKQREYYDEYMERNDRLKDKNIMMATVASVPKDSSKRPTMT